LNGQYQKTPSITSPTVQFGTKIGREGHSFKQGKGARSVAMRSRGEGRDRGKDSSGAWRVARMSGRDGRTALEVDQSLTLASVGRGGSHSSRKGNSTLCGRGRGIKSRRTILNSDYLKFIPQGYQKLILLDPEEGNNYGHGKRKILYRYSWGGGGHRAAQLGAFTNWTDTRRISTNSLSGTGTCVWNGRKPDRKKK